MANKRDTSRPTEREREILKLLCDGYNSKEIGGILDISHRTVERHRFNLMTRLNIQRLAGLIKYAIRNGITELN